METIMNGRIVRGDVGKLVARLKGGEPLAEILGVDEEILEALEGQAYLLYLRRHYDKADVLARGVLALDEERPLAHLIVGDVALAEFRFQEGARHLERTHELAPELQEVRGRLGECLMKAGRPGEARGHLEAAMGGPLSEEARRRCAALLEQL